MKKIIIILVLVVGCIIINAQVPQGFNYQAIARDGSGNPITGATINVKMGILSDTTTPVIVREELFSSITTNAYGLFSLVLGTGTFQAGSVTNFSDINWNTTPLFLRIQINYLGNWKNMGSTKLWSVPYSLIAKDLGGSLSKLKVKGSETSMDSALFEVKNKTGQTVFAVYNEGVRVYVDDGLTKGVKGGFAIGGFDSKGVAQDYLVVNSDSIRAYIDSNPLVKGSKGGFAIVGFGAAKTQSEEYLRVTRDSTRVYVNEPVKGSKGGFAIGGFSDAKGDINNFLDLTPENYFIGQRSGKLTTGLYNSFLGFETGIVESNGEKNVFIGYHSGMNNTNASFNVFLGNETGLSNQGDYNTFLGFQSGYSNTIGSSNCFIGKMSGKLNTKGHSNVFIGFESGYNNTGSDIEWQGSYNTFIGSNTGHENTTGGSNIFIGVNAGQKNTSGYRNIILGVDAGTGNTTGSDNIYLGYAAGQSNIGGNSNILFGNQAGCKNVTGSENIFFGTWSGGFGTSAFNNICIGRQTGMQSNGSDNVYIGPMVGMYNTVGNNNLFIGSSAGLTNSSGSGNVFLGYHSGYNELGSNKLYIANSEVDSTLIYGDFSSKIVGIGTSHPVTKLEVAVSGTNGYSGIGIRSSLSGGKLITLNQGVAGKLNLTEPGVTDLVTFDFNTSNVGILNGSPTYTLQVNGSVASTSAFNNLSDIRYKKDVEPITGALNKIMALQGITFNWDKTSNPELNVDDKNHFGFSAQDIEKILPQVVSTAVDKKQTKSVAYGDVVPVLVEAIKEQQQQIESVKQENQQLKLELDEFKALVNSLIDNQTRKANYQPGKRSLNCSLN